MMAWGSCLSSRSGMGVTERRSNPFFCFFFFPFSACRREMDGAPDTEQGGDGRSGQEESEGALARGWFRLPFLLSCWSMARQIRPPFCTSRGLSRYEFCSLSLSLSLCPFPGGRGLISNLGVGGLVSQDRHHHYLLVEV